MFTTQTFAQWLLICTLLNVSAPMCAETDLLPKNLEQQQAPPKTPDEGLQRLISGNKRYIDDKSTCPDRNQERRQAIYSKQTPFAVILGCSDSRVSPEIIFDQGAGDLFVVRNAGNVIGLVEMDSIEYGINHLKASVVLVLGHENCGAVTAVVEGDTKDIEAVAAFISPAVAESRNLPGNPIENAVKMNVKRAVQNLKASKELSSLIQEKQLIIVGGYYNLHTGLVEIL